MSLISMHAGIMALGSSPIYFDPAATHSSITLSNGNLTASGNANSGGHSKGNVEKSSGKWYVEATFDVFSAAGTNGAGILGLETTASTLASYLGQSSGCCGLWYVGAPTSAARAFLAGVQSTPGVAITAGGTAMLAWDADAGLVWYGANGTFAGNPAAGTGAAHNSASLQGAHRFATGPRNNGNRASLRSTPAYPVPAGFNYWSP